jgi:hypothetical protein
MTRAAKNYDVPRFSKVDHVSPATKWCSRMRRLEIMFLMIKKNFFSIQVFRLSKDFFEKRK